MTSQSDETLVALVRAGHERAFTAIVERYRPELYSLARRLSADGNGEDILQQAFLGAFAALRAGAEVQHLRGWLYRIVRNSAARSRTPGCVPLDATTASFEALEDIVEQRALALDALAELARLPTRQRQAIVGMALDGRPRAEVAGSMGLSEGAVRQLVHRARARLRTVVTAVTPWPLARWISGGRPGGGGAVEVAAGAGAGAASSGGVVGLKLGVVLASGAIATGVAAVGIHGARHVRAPAPSPAAASGARSVASAGHRRAGRPRVQRVEVAAVGPAIVSRSAAPARSPELAPAPAVAVVTRVVYRAPVRSSRTRSTPVVVVHRPDRERGDKSPTAPQPVRRDGGGGTGVGGGSETGVGGGDASGLSSSRGTGVGGGSETGVGGGDGSGLSGGGGSDSSGVGGTDAGAVGAQASSRGRDDGGGGPDGGGGSPDGGGGGGSGH